MSFTIKIQRNNSPLTKVDKSITEIVTLTGTLRNESDTLNPTIIVQATDAQLLTANYMTIESFKRRYFIEEIKSVRTNIYEIRAHVDVLSTFASQIRQNTAVVLRQENKFNLLLNDGVFKCDQNPMFFTRVYPSGLGQFNFILITQGGTDY